MSDIVEILKARAKRIEDLGSPRAELLYEAAEEITRLRAEVLKAGQVPDDLHRRISEALADASRERSRAEAAEADAKRLYPPGSCTSCGMASCHILGHRSKCPCAARAGKALLQLFQRVFR